MTDKIIIQYQCERCGQKFDAPQGSRRKLCPECLVKAVNKEG